MTVDRRLIEVEGVRVRVRVAEEGGAGCQFAREPRKGGVEPAPGRRVVVVINVVAVNASTAPPPSFAAARGGVRVRVNVFGPHLGRPRR